MQKFFASLIAQFRDFYKTLTPTKRVSLVVAFLIVISATLIMTFMVSERGFVTLLKDVPTDQMPTILAKLKEKNIPFAVGEGGNAVLIPPQLLYSTQMALMSEIGNNRIGSIGFEIFEKQDFGTTSYAQRVNYQRALQGELMRAINTIEVVQRSKVILALPPKKTFLEEGSQPTASVVVDLIPGKTLNQEQVKGITHLVASAVEGLDPDRVTVVDSRGKSLSKNLSGAAAQSSQVSEMKEHFEKQVEERIEAILSKVVGQGKVIAKVNATLNNQDMTAVQETVDPDATAVRTSQTEEEALDGARRNPAGVPGARANLPGSEETGQVAFSQNVNKTFNITNYEVPKTVKNIKEAPGRVEKVSVSVLVDGVEKTVAGEGGESKTEWSPRTEAELKKYEALIKSAVGFDAKRGDVVTIENIQFEKEDFTDSERLLNSLERRKLVSYIVKWSVIGLAFLLFFFLVVKPFMRWITDNFQESVSDILPKTIEELEELQTVDNSLPGMAGALPMLEESIDPDKAESDLLKERIIGLMQGDEKKAAAALGMWLVRKDF